MPDWMAYVERHLPLPGMRSARRDKILRELASQAEDIYQGARAGGASPEEALRCVERQVGDWGQLASGIHRAEKPGLADDIERRAAALEEVALRRRGGWMLLMDALGDLRFYLRAMRKRPLPAVVAVLTLALGIGAATAIFSAMERRAIEPAAPDRYQRRLRLTRGSRVRALVSAVPGGWSHNARAAGEQSGL